MPRCFPLCLVLMVVAALTAGCGGDDAPRGPEPATFAGAVAPAGPLIITHAGAGSPSAWRPRAEAGCDAAAVVLRDGGDALAVAVAAVVALEDDPLLNAGTGANIRLDGRTIQMDAALMTGAGEFAAVAAIERVRHPILVARAVLDTPHRLLVGEGATRFAHVMGFEDVVPTCPEAEAKWRRRVARLLRGEAGGGYDTFDWRRAWNFEAPIPTPADTLVADPVTGDTVGAVVRDAAGGFAATLSTGGTSITLHGRVGDVPIYGCGCFAGPAGAVACTGHGEEIIRQALARKVYELMAAGAPVQDAVRRGIAGFPPQWTVGVIAVGRDGWGVAANTDMAYGATVAAAAAEAR
jgi:beta-aspartyl-peptidase (threonine type)